LKLQASRFDLLQARHFDVPQLFLPHYHPRANHNVGQAFSLRRTSVRLSPQEAK
jgi:hypothetical protein